MNRRRARDTIAAICELRENQWALERCIGTSDRTFNTDVYRSERRRLEQSCKNLFNKVARLQKPTCKHSVVRAVERNFDAGKPLTYDSKLRNVEGIAEVFTNWFAPASRLRSINDVRKALAYLERHSRSYRDRSLKAVPHLAIPSFISNSESLAPLQNLPAWQSARLTLIACAISNARPSPSEIRRWCSSLDVIDKYVAYMQYLTREQ